MSRFNFALIATIFACFSLVSCEKEDFTPSATETIAAEETAPHQAVFEALPVTESAVELLAKLRAETSLAPSVTRFTVTAEQPIEETLRYIESFPSGSAPAVEIAKDQQPILYLEADCPYGDCDTTIPAMVAEYQEIANAQCNDQFLCIACCAGGGVLYVVVYIESDCPPMRLR